MAKNASSWIRLFLVVISSAMLGFVVTSIFFEPALADGTHYEQSDWSSNPVMWGNSNMYYPLSNYEGAVFAADDPWDAVSGSWINILVQGSKALPHSISASDVDDYQIWWTDFYSSDATFLCSTGKTYNYVLFQITRARIQCNENNNIAWHSHTSTALAANKIDILTTLIHETGHAIGVQHRTVAMNGTADGYGFCDTSTSNTTNFTSQATMCEWVVKWTGSGTIYPHGRTLHSHEASDLANNY